jgi:hypothetical protein
MTTTELWMIGREGPNGERQYFDQAFHSEGEAEQYMEDHPEDFTDDCFVFGPMNGMRQQ